MLQITQDQIHLWLAFDNEIKSESLIADYRRLLLNEDERQKEKRFYFAKDQHQYLVTRALVKTVLSRYAAVAPENWRFSKNKYGRPEIANEETRSQQLTFNISHSAGLIIMGVTCRQALGVDTENIVQRQAPLDIANRFFSPQETAALYALPLATQFERFFYYWTLKESYIKARGMGLSIPLDQFSFSFPDAQDIQIAFQSKIKDTPSNWRFWLLKPTESHLATVCVNRTSAVPQQLIVRKVVPLESDALFDYAILRQSDLLAGNG